MNQWHKNDNYSPLVSVVMSVYNGEQYLAEAIDSILSQTYTNFEFIIINDGSTDSSGTILKSYEAADTRIRLITQSNHGLVYSLNKGCKSAKGALIARMDADDVSLPSRLEQEVKAFSTNEKLCITGTYFSYIDEESKLLGTVITMPTKDVDLRRALYIVNPFAHGSTMFRKSAWEAAGGYSDKYGPTEDYELWRRLASNPLQQLSIIPDVLYLYRINPEGISQQKADTQAKFTKKIADEQWSKPYLGKGIRGILKDGDYYLRLHYTLGDGIFGTYYNQQILIMSRLFADRHFLTGIKMATAVFAMCPRVNRILLLRSIIGGFLRKIGVKH